MTKESERGKYISVVGALITVVGSFLPWVIVGGGQYSVMGVEGQGLFTVTFSLIAAGVVLFREWNQLEQTGVIAMGILTLIVIMNVFSSMGEVPEGQVIALTTEPAVGLYASLVGGAVLVLGGIIGYAFAANEVEQISEKAVDSNDIPTQLERYKQLEEEGVLTEEEFERKKTELLE